VSKGSKQRPTDKNKFDENWERIFGKAKEERLREPIRHKYTESDKPSKWGYAYFKEGSLQPLEYSVQYNAPTEDYR